jgi:NUMOD4 motif
MQEIWIDIPKYEGHYKVSNTGKIMSFKTKKPKVLKMSPDSTGKFRVGLCRYERVKYYYVHRLVYFSFNKIKMDSDISVVHSDYNMQNNSLDNLLSMSLGEASNRTVPKSC